MPNASTSAQHFIGSLAIASIWANLMSFGLRLLIGPAILASLHETKINQHLADDVSAGKFWEYLVFAPRIRHTYILLAQSLFAKPTDISPFPALQPHLPLARKNEIELTRILRPHSRLKRDSPKRCPMSPRDPGPSLTAHAAARILGMSRCAALQPHIAATFRVNMGKGQRDPFRKALSRQQPRI
jgi:hypothetical protein